jgi:dihydrofolate reductase
VKEVIMSKLVAFNNITLDGYFAGADGDIGWAHRPVHDPEFESFVEENSKGDGVLVMGRVTYELMAGYWPTELASRNDPVVADRMNSLPKLVFSRTLKRAVWQNTRLVSDDLVGTIRRMKKEPGSDLTILGSGSIVSQLAREGMIDEFQIVLNPVVIGNGRTLFDGVARTLNLKLTRTRAFANGNALLCYTPADGSFASGS